MKAIGRLALSSLTVEPTSNPGTAEAEKTLDKLASSTLWERADDLFDEQIKALQPKDLTEIPREQIDAIWVESDPLNPDQRSVKQKWAATEILRYGFNVDELKKIAGDVGHRTFLAITSIAIGGSVITPIVEGVVLGHLGWPTIGAALGNGIFGGIAGGISGLAAGALKNSLLAKTYEAPFVVTRAIKHREKEIQKIEDLREGFNDRDRYRRKIGAKLDSVYNNG